MLVGGLASREEPEVDRSVTYLPPVAAPGATPPARIIEVERVRLVVLPELPATATVLRLAKQVRSASSHGRCDAAWIMWMDLQKVDAAYAGALRDGPVMAPCAQ